MISGWFFTLVAVALDRDVDRQGGESMEILKLTVLSAASVLGAFAVNVSAAAG
jgi:hypothetical protein